MISGRGMLRGLWTKYWSGVKNATALRGVDYSEELMLWDFRGEGAVRGWSCTSDKQNGGLSRAVFTSNRKGTGALFQGVLSTKIPAGTGMKYSGYCAIRSKPLKANWFAAGSFDISEYDALLLRVKGDGRKFTVNIQCPSLARQDDVWQCFMFTRGGPQWEDIKLPYKEFFITNRGYMQDHQMTFSSQSVNTVGILLADRTNGPFTLEIQYIKAVRLLT